MIFKMHQNNIVSKILSLAKVKSCTHVFPFTNILVCKILKANMSSYSTVALKYGYGQNHICMPFYVHSPRLTRFKHSKVDMSKVPVLCEDDLEEWYVKGSGPGGSNVNKRTNACSLRHKPSGIVIKCHLSRELSENRKLGRKMMIEKLDEYYNGEDSVQAQKDRILMKKSHTMELKSKKTSELKKKYKDLIQEDTEEKCSNLVRPTESS